MLWLSNLLWPFGILHYAEKEVLNFNFQGKPLMKKSRIQETNNLLTDADSRTKYKKIPTSKTNFAEEKK